MAADTRARSFTAWRRARPFGAGLCMILGGAVILTPAYLTFDVQGLLISISSLSGVSTLLIGALLITCGVLCWRGGDARILVGITSLILAIVALPASNFGGFILGTVLALVGGAMALAWSPDEDDAPPQPPVPTDSVQPDPGQHGAGKGQRGTESAAFIVALALAGAVISAPAGLPEVASATPTPTPTTTPTSAPAPALSSAPRPAPAPRPGERAVSDSMEIITADSVRLLGNVGLSVAAVAVPSGEVVRAIRLDADRVELDNLGLRAIGVDVGLATAPGDLSTLDGNFHIIVRSLTVTPATGDGQLVPLTIDARWVDDALLDSLAADSLGLPDAITDELILRDVSLEAFVVRADRLRLPASASIG